MAEGADVILPVAGPVGLGAAAAISEEGKMMIGVDSDQYYAAADRSESEAQQERCC